MYLYMYIYIYIEREIHTYIYIYVYTSVLAVGEARELQRQAWEKGFSLSGLLWRG